MNKKQTTRRQATPKLRFPEFRDAGEWEERLLGDIAKLIEERAGSDKHTPMSVTAGVGLVAQEEKFGREIAGNQYRSYFVIREGDFAYNKSATKQYPEGFVTMLEGQSSAAVPNSIFTCFRVEGDVINRHFLNYVFSANFHGAWLRRFITIGARAHGALNVNSDDLLRMPLRVPSLLEQEKIADCLSSLDSLIAAQRQKLDTLKAHKQGLLQQLFPAEGETVPRLRFPEFREAREWEEKSIGSVCQSFSGGTPSTLEQDFYGGDIPFIRSAEIEQDRTALFLTNKGFESSAARLVKKGDVLVALYGANSGEVALARLDGAINQAILCLRSQGSNAFIYQALSHKKDWLVATYIQGGQGNLSAAIIKSIQLPFPSLDEQHKIAGCLSSLDDLIAAQHQKLDAFNAHKQGLLQQLFPSPDEV